MTEHKCRCAGCTKARKAGAEQERARVLELWNIEMQCDCEEAMQHLALRIQESSDG